MSAVDTDRLARWVARLVAGGDEPVVMAPLRPDPDAAPRWVVDVGRGTAATRVVLKAGPEPGMRVEVATEAAALAVAAEHDLATPRLVGVDLSGDEAGCAALVMSFVEGSDRIPVEVGPDRLRALGAAAAPIHLVERTPTDELPLRRRHMPWVDLSARRRRGKAPTTEVLERGDALAGQLSPPHPRSTLVHGDLWAGNTLWRDRACVAVVDWEAAGCGDPGVDIGALRLDAALLHGDAAPDVVLEGWLDAGGPEPPDIEGWVAYWDLVAALNTSAGMDGFVSTVHQAGRTDLGAVTLADRRDQFLDAAIARLS